MNQDEVNQEEWHNPWNWRGPKFLSVYYSPRDSRLWVPKQVSGLGWTVNMGHSGAIAAIGVIGSALFFALIITLVVFRWSMLSSATGPWLWLTASLTLAVVAMFLNASCRYHISWVPVALTLGFLAALTGFGIQILFNLPVVALLGSENLTWRAHLYLAFGASAPQTFGKWLLIPVGWKLLQAETFSDKMRIGLIIGLGFTVLEIVLIWSHTLREGVSITAWELGALERGIASMFHIYSTGLLAIGLARRWRLPLALVIGVHYLTDWAVGANESLLNLSDAQLQIFLFLPVLVVWLIFLGASKMKDRPLSN